MTRTGFLVPFFCVLAATAGEPRLVESGFEDFSDPGVGGEWSYFWGSGGGGAIGVGHDPDDAANGVGAFSYSIADGGGYVVMRCGRALEEGVEKLSLRVHSTGIGPQFAARVHDVSGETLLFELARTMDWNGWRPFELDLAHPTAHWGGDNDGAIAHPAHFSVQVQSEGGAKGTVLFDDIRQIVRIDERNRYVFTAGSDHPGNIFFGSEEMQMTFRVSDRLGEAGKYLLYIFYTDCRGVTPKSWPIELSLAEGADGVEYNDPWFPRQSYNFAHYTIRALLLKPDGTLLKTLETTAAHVRERADGRTGESAFGMNLGLPSRGGADMEGYAKLAAASGAGWTRDDFSWEQIEPVKGEFHWERTDCAVAAAQAAGLRTLGLIAYCASWAREFPKEYTSPPRDPQDYAEFVYRVVSRYKDRVHHWELWNEPDSPVSWKPKPDAAAYAELAKAAYDAAKRADPDCVVMPAGLLVGMNHPDQWDYLDGLFDAGLLGHFDRFAWHAYCDPKSPEEGRYEERTQELVDRLRARGSEAPLWLTEEGWHTRGAAKSRRVVSEDDQAAYLVRAHVLALSNPAVETFFWFLFRDGGNREDDPDQSYGILHPDGTPKKAFAAYAEMTRQLAGTKPLGRVVVPGRPEVQVHEFLRDRAGDPGNHEFLPGRQEMEALELLKDRADDKESPEVEAALKRLRDWEDESKEERNHVFVLWCPTGTVQLALPLGSLKVRYGMYGWSIMPTESGAEIKVGPKPIYLIETKKTARLIREHPGKPVVVVKSP